MRGWSQPTTGIESRYAPDVWNALATPLDFYTMILSAAMMCQYDLLQPDLAKLLEDAVEAVLDAGYRTRDIVNEGNADETLVGCKEMGDLVAAKVAELAA